MHRLSLLRHGHAAPYEEYEKDFDRPLTQRGEGEARDIGLQLARCGLVPDLIIASTGVRAWNTALLVAQQLGLQPGRLSGTAKAYNAGADALLELVRGCEASLQHVLVCAHNPGLSHLASRLGPSAQRRDLRTANLASALWREAEWSTLEPEDADEYQLLIPGQGNAAAFP